METALDKSDHESTHAAIIARLRKNPGDYQRLDKMFTEIEELFRTADNHLRDNYPQYVPSASVWGGYVLFFRECLRKSSELALRLADVVNNFITTVALMKANHFTRETSPETIAAVRAIIAGLDKVIDANAVIEGGAEKVTDDFRQLIGYVKEFPVANDDLAHMPFTQKLQDEIDVLDKQIQGFNTMLAGVKAELFSKRMTLETGPFAWITSIKRKEEIAELEAREVGLHKEINRLTEVKSPMAGGVGPIREAYNMLSVVADETESILKAVEGVKMVQALVHADTVRIKNFLNTVVSLMVDAHNTPSLVLSYLKAGQDVSGTIYQTLNDTLVAFGNGLKAAVVPTP